MEPEKIESQPTKIRKKRGPMPKCEKCGMTSPRKCPNKMCYIHCPLYTKENNGLVCPKKSHNK